MITNGAARPTLRVPLLYVETTLSPGLTMPQRRAAVRPPRPDRAARLRSRLRVRALYHPRHVDA